MHEKQCRHALVDVLVLVVPSGSCNIVILFQDGLREARYIKGVLQVRDLVCNPMRRGETRKTTDLYSASRHRYNHIYGYNKQKGKALNEDINCERDARKEKEEVISKNTTG